MHEDHLDSRGIGALTNQGSNCAGVVVHNAGHFVNYLLKTQIKLIEIL